jgi:hypothetical protein
VSLIFRCKKQRKQLGAAEGDLFAKGQSGMLPNSVRLIAEIWLAAQITKCVATSSEISLLRQRPMRYLRRLFGAEMQPARRFGGVFE